MNRDLDYTKIKSFLSDEIEDQEVYLSDDELDRLVTKVMNTVYHSEHVGFMAHRIEHNSLEKAFAEQWLKENEPQGHINFGHGILQDLFFEQPKGSLAHKSTARCATVINERDRYIVATVIQWLGTNVGMGFLRTTLAKEGYQITKHNDLTTPQGSKQK